MARTNFTFTFTNAQPGSPVTFSAHIWPATTGDSEEGPRLILDANNSVSVYSDATILAAAAVDGLGHPITATATKTSPSITTTDGTAPTNPFGSGGSSAVGSAIYQATSLVLPAAASTLMTFARNAGDDLLDLTDPQSPTAKQAGLYTVTQNALVGVTSAGHVLWGQVDLDLSGEDGWSWGEVALLVDGGADPSLSVSATYYVPAGGVITSTLNQNTGADLTLESWYTVVAFVAASRVT